MRIITLKIVKDSDSKDLHIFLAASLTYLCPNYSLLMEGSVVIEVNQPISNLHS